MSNEIFDRETKLDLLVNVIPLFIMGFFIVGFLVFAPFGVDPLASSIQFGLVAIPFVLLTVLTYFAAVAVAGSERSAPVYLPGQAGVSGAEPLEVPDEDDGAESGDAEAAAELDDDTGSEEGERGGDEDDESEADSEDGDVEEAGDTEEETDADDAEEDESDADDAEEDESDADDADESERGA